MGQSAMAREGLDPDDRIVTPGIALVRLPEIQAYSKHTTVEARCELQEPGKQRLMVNRDGWDLDQGYPRMPIHQLHHFNQRSPFHQAIGIEHHHISVAAAPIAHEIGQVAAFTVSVFSSVSVK